MLTGAIALFYLSFENSFELKKKMFFLCGVFKFFVLFLTNFSLMWVL